VATAAAVIGPRSSISLAASRRVRPSVWSADLLDGVGPSTRSTERWGPPTFFTTQVLRISLDTAKCHATTVTRITAHRRTDRLIFVHLPENPLAGQLRCHRGGCC
jgi:hypothetical protein